MDVTELWIESLRAGEARIPLRNKRGEIRAYALVDESDCEALTAHNWHLTSEGYARCARPAITMHRWLLGLTPSDKHQVDHINGNRLDNRRCNLRVVTAVENAQNRHVTPNSAAVGRGVSFSQKRNRWVARVQGKGGNHATFHETAEDAARAVKDMRAEYMPGSQEALDAFQAKVVSTWMEGLQAAYGLAYGERRNELAGNYVKSRDGRGLHPYSYVFGQVKALEGLDPVLQDEMVSVDPIALRKVAHADADAEFRAEILAEAS